MSVLDHRSVGVRGIVFSKDRPLQLDGVLSSLEAMCLDRDLVKLAVLWVASDDRTRALYHEALSVHQDVESLPESNFARDLQNAVGSARYVMFLVDDALFVREFRVAEAIASLVADDHSLGFSLRLGTNTTYCYPKDSDQALPSFDEPAPGVLGWDWTRAELDFGYPLEVSSSLYRGVDLRRLLGRLSFRNPNSLEGQLARSAGRFRRSRPRLLSFNSSVAFCAPMNIVQDVSPNRASSDPALSSRALADLFETGHRLAIDAYRGFVPRGCHEEVALHLVDAPPAPVVSVVIPCYGQAMDLPAAVRSVVDQSFSDWELIIVDDGSPDDAADVAERLIASHGAGRLRLLRQANAGVASARNAGIAQARGRYVLPLDADDALDPAMLTTCVSELRTRADVSIVYTDQVRFGDEERRVRLPEFNADLECETNLLPYCSMFRRGVWLAVGGYNPNMVEGYEDWDFWVGAVQGGFRAARIPMALSRYRVRSGSRDARAFAHRRALRERIASNHRPLYTPTRRVRRRTRSLLWSIRRRLGRSSSRPETR